jgi:hypothetical protein
VKWGILGLPQVELALRRLDERVGNLMADCGSPTGSTEGARPLQQHYTTLA